MTSEQLRQIAAQAIAATQLVPYKYYHLCWWDKKLQCLPVYHTAEKHTVFFSAPGEVLKCELSPYQWKLIETRMVDFCKGKNIRLRSKSGSEQQEQEKSVKESKLQVTEFDCTRLKTVLARAKLLGSSKQAQLDKLQQILQNAEIVPPEKIPGDVVTMNSTVRLKDCRSDTEMVLSLLFPGDADIDTNFEHIKVSILTPIGVSVFARRVGETLEGGIKVDGLLYQPEAAAHFDL